MRLLAMAMVLCWVYAASLYAEANLVDIFSVENQPGSGHLSYVQGEKPNEKAETLSFGKKHGHYVFGMIFKADRLPEPYKKDLGKNEILQIAMGSLRQKGGFQIPQFGAASLMSPGGMEKKNVFQLTVPSGQETKKGNLGLLLFTHPSTPTEQTDEDKLKGTFFAEKGTLTVSPLQKAKTFPVLYQGKKYSFKVRPMKMEFDAALATPFSAQKNTLRGSVEMPVYWPGNLEAETLVGMIAGASMGGMGAAVPGLAEGYTQSNRDVAGSTKKDVGSPAKEAESP